MNTVQKNNNITKKQVQELLENNQKKLGLKERSIVTISALIAKGITDSSLKYHLQTAKKQWDK